mmetsp:Transcript_69965/g.200504  ORF Transcript_69965/g.200504 Transcript_69965/m.200504 type:complete len:275 (+) Transcript_69965:910-1734(+)
MQVQHLGRCVAELADGRLAHARQTANKGVGREDRLEDLCANLDLKRLADGGQQRNILLSNGLRLEVQRMLRGAHDPQRELRVCAVVPQILSQRGQIVVVPAGDDLQPCHGGCDPADKRRRPDETQNQHGHREAALVGVLRLNVHGADELRQRPMQTSGVLVEQSFPLEAVLQNPAASVVRHHRPHPKPRACDAMAQEDEEQGNLQDANDQQASLREDPRIELCQQRGELEHPDEAYDAQHAGDAGGLQDADNRAECHVVEKNLCPIAGNCEEVE